MTRPATTPHPGLGLAQVCLAGVLWGTGGLALRLLREDVPMSVLVVGAWRMGIATVVLLAVVVALRQRADLVALLRDRPGRAALVGAGTGAYQALYFASVVDAGVTVATVVSLGLAPVLLTVAEAVRDRRMPGRTRVLVLLGALLGLVLVSLATEPSGAMPHPVRGLLLAVASGTTYAVTTALAPAVARGHTPLALTTVATTAGALVLTPLAVWSAAQGSPWTTTETRPLLLLAYLGVMTMALAYLLLYAGLRTAPASSAVVASLLEPVTAAVMAAALLGERLGVLGVVGSGLILLAVVGLREPPGPRTLANTDRAVGI